MKGVPKGRPFHLLREGAILLRSRNGVIVTRNHMLSGGPRRTYHPSSPADGLALADWG